MDAKYSNIKAPSSPKSLEKPVSNSGDDGQSEYSETISIVSFSDTDDELAEIEKKQYADGRPGKEEAYKDIEKVFDELENENLLDPFTRWRPKEEPPDVKKRLQFVPKRPAALPRKVVGYDRPVEPKADGKSKSRKVTDAVNEQGKATYSKLKNDTPSPSAQTVNALKSKKFNQVGSPHRTIVAELIMEENQEEAKLKKEREMAKRALTTAMTNKTDSGSGDVPSTPTQPERPTTASSVITSVDDEECAPVPVSKVPQNRDYLTDYRSVAEAKYPTPEQKGSKKQRLVRDEYTRKRQLAVHRDMTILKNISPLVTHRNDDEPLNISKVESASGGVTRTTPTYKTQYEMRLAAASEGNNNWGSTQEANLTIQELLIQDLAQSPKKDLRKDNNQQPQKVISDDKTIFKIIYKEPRWPHQVTLDKTIDRLYRVKHLILDDSQIKSLRDITSLLPSLIVLSVKNCGLKTLDGTLAFPNLQKLFAADNQLTHPAQCSLLSELQELDLSGNPVESFEGFEYLSVLLYLKVLKVYDTKLSQEKGFQLELRKLIPSLRDIYPKNKSLDCDFDIDDDDYLSVDYKLLGKTEEELRKEQEMLKRAVHETSMITNTTTITPPSSIRKWPRRINSIAPAGDFQNASLHKEASHAEMKLRSLISTVGDSETEDFECLEKSGLKNFKNLCNYMNTSGKTTDDEELGHGDVSSEVDVSSVMGGNYLEDGTTSLECESKFSTDRHFTDDSSDEEQN